MKIFSIRNDTAHLRSMAISSGSSVFKDCQDLVAIDLELRDSITSGNFDSFVVEVRGALKLKHLVVY